VSNLAHIQVAADAVETVAPAGSAGPSDVGGGGCTVDGAGGWTVPGSTLCRSCPVLTVSGCKAQGETILRRLGVPWKSLLIVLVNGSVRPVPGLISTRVHSDVGICPGRDVILKLMDAEKKGTYLVGL
jgi:hypothetical protein